MVALNWKKLSTLSILCLIATACQNNSKELTTAVFEASPYTIDVLSSVSYPRDCKLYPTGPRTKKIRDAISVRLQCSTKLSDYDQPHLWILNTNDLSEVELAVEAASERTSCIGGASEYALSENFGIYRYCTKRRGDVKNGDWQSYSLSILTTPINRADSQSAVHTLIDHSKVQTSVIGLSLNPIGGKEFLLVAVNKAELGVRGRPDILRLEINELEPVTKLDPIELPEGRNCKTERNCSVRSVHVQGDDLFILYDVYGGVNQRLISRYERADEGLNLVAEKEFLNGRNPEQIQAYENGFVLLFFGDQGSLDTTSKIEVRESESLTLLTPTFGELEAVNSGLSGVALAQELNAAIVLYRDSSIASVSIFEPEQPRSISVPRELKKLFPRQIWPTDDPSQFILVGGNGIAKIAMRAEN